MPNDIVTFDDTSKFYRVTHPHWVIDELCIGDTTMFSAENNRETKACEDICRACFRLIWQKTGKDAGEIDFRVLEFETVRVGPPLEVVTRTFVSRYSRPVALM